MANDITVRIDATSAQFDRAMGQAQKATLRYGASLKVAQKAQAEYDAAVAKSGASSQEARLAQEKLGAALARTTEAEIRAGIAAKEAGEIQAASSAKAAAAAESAAAKQSAAADKEAAAQEKLAASRKASAASAVQSVTGFSAQTTGLLAVGAAFAYAVKSAAEFESKMAQVQSLTHGSAAQIAALSAATKNYADIGISASQAADAEIELVKAGVSVNDILGGALTGTLDAAAAGQIDVAQATEIASAAMVQFGLSGREIPHVADLLAAGADKSLGGINDLGEGLKAVGTTAHQFGLSIDETVGALSQFAAAGLTGSLGGTALKQALLKLEAPSVKAAAIMQDYGISLYDAGGNTVTLANLAGQLQHSFQGVSAATRNAALATLFGSRAVQVANVLYKDGAAVTQDWVNKVNDSGFAAEQASGKMDSLSGDLQKLKADLQNLAIAQGEGAQSPLRKLAQDADNAVPAIGGLINAFSGLDKISFGGLTKALDPLSGAIGALGKIGGAVGGIGSTFSGDDAGFDAEMHRVDLLEAAYKRLPEGQSAVHAMGQSVDELGGSFGALAPKANAAGAGLDDYAGKTKGAADATQSLADKLKALSGAFDANQAALEQSSALLDYKAALDAVGQALKDNGKTLQSGTEAGRANIAVTNAIASAANDYANTLEVGSKKQIAYLESARTSLYNQRIAFGDTDTAARKYVDTVLSIPDSVKTKADIDTVAATQQIKDLQHQYGLTPAQVRTIVEAAGATTAAQQVLALRNYIDSLRSKTVEVQVNTILRTYSAPGGHSVYSPSAAGNIYEAYSAGGMRENHIAQIGKPGVTRVWNEPETGGEVYAPLANDWRRPRAKAIIAEGAARMGGTVAWNAAGSISNGVAAFVPGQAIISELRGIRADLNDLSVRVNNPMEVATGVRSVADDSVAQNQAHRETMAGMYA